MALIEALKLPLDERGQRRAAARAEWFAAAGQAARDPRPARGLSGHCLPIASMAAEATLWRGCRAVRRRLLRDRALDSCHEQRPARQDDLHRPNATRRRRLVPRRDRRVSRAREDARPAPTRRPPRPADLCARRHHEPAADLGHRLPAAGRHVPRGRRDRRARRAARLLPRACRMPRLALGRRSRNGSAI